MMTSEEAGTAEERQPVAEMSLPDVLAFLQGLEQATFQDINQAYSRLIAIGLFEHGYKDAERDTALGVADTIKVQVLKTLADHPDLKAEFEQAAAMQVQQAKFSGIGSSAWLAEERRLREPG
jgi:hypothetical protein